MKAVHGLTHWIGLTLCLASLYSQGNEECILEVCISVIPVSIIKFNAQIQTGIKYKIMEITSKKEGALYSEQQPTSL